MKKKKEKSLSGEEGEKLNRAENKENISNDYLETRVEWKLLFQTLIHGSFAFWLDEVGGWKIVDRNDGQGEGEIVFVFFGRLDGSFETATYVAQQQIDQLVAQSTK